jgi:two-component sensor histidine kinase
MSIDSKVSANATLVRASLSTKMRNMFSAVYKRLSKLFSNATRRHLRDTHQRVMSVAAVQQQLHAAAPGASVELEPYLTKLCRALGQSMIGDNRAIAFRWKPLRTWGLMLKSPCPDLRPATLEAG